jgi:hypothetical protein
MTKRPVCKFFVSFQGWFFTAFATSECEAAILFACWLKERQDIRQIFVEVCTEQQYADNQPGVKVCVSSEDYVNFNARILEAEDE